MMRKLLSICALGLLIITGCKNDDPGLLVGGNVYNTYQPVSKGTFWKYTITSLNFNPQTETQTITGTSDLINKKRYYTIRTQNGTADDTLSRFSHTDENYTIRSVSKTGGFTTEYLYLQDNPVAGKTWTATVTDDGMVNGVPARIVGVVIEKDISKTISGKKFGNVVHTRLQFQYDQGDGYQTVNVIDYYIAKSVGIIEIDYYDGKTLTSSKVIADYDIK